MKFCFCSSTTLSLEGVWYFTLQQDHSAVGKSANPRMAKEWPDLASTHHLHWLKKLNTVNDSLPCLKSCQKQIKHPVTVVFSNLLRNCLVYIKFDESAHWRQSNETRLLKCTKTGGVQTSNAAEVSLTSCCCCWRPWRTREQSVRWVQGSPCYCGCCMKTIFTFL